MSSMSAAVHPADPRELPSTEPHRDVIRSGLDAAGLTVALREMRDAGLTTVEHALPLQVVENLREAYDALLESGPEGTVQNTSGQHHVAMQLPIRPPFSDPLVVTHPALRQVAGALLGDDFTCCFYNSNTALP